MIKIDKKLLKQARQIVFTYNNYSISFLQRKLEISYNRACILMDIIKRSRRRGKKRYIRLWSKKKKRFCYVK